jgi:hypothetical protein
MLEMLVAAMLIQAVAFGWYGVIRLTRSVRHTSLTAAVAWAAWLQTTLTVTTIATLAKNRVSPGLLDQLWYLTAVSALCPLVAVLGARRGRLLEWSVFIVLPVVVVLEWPALAQLVRCWNGQRLELELPTKLGYAVVLVMGAGNFVGTRFTLPAFAFAACWGAITFLDHSSVEKPWMLRVPAFFVSVAQVCFWSWAFHVANQQKPLTNGWTRVSLDFRDHFGVVWSTRLTARINEIARREQWPWVLTAEGLESISGENQSASTATTDPRVDQTFRWLLKPFVDSEWIDERLTASRDLAATNGS